MNLSPLRMKQRCNFKYYDNTTRGYLGTDGELERRKKRKTDPILPEQIGFWWRRDYIS